VFYVNPAVCRCVYFNSRVYITPAGGPIESSRSNWPKGDPVNICIGFIYVASIPVKGRCLSGFTGDACETEVSQTSDDLLRIVVPVAIVSGLIFILLIGYCFRKKNFVVQLC
jgi:hypothetical protein